MHPSCTLWAKTYRNLHLQHQALELEFQQLPENADIPTLKSLFQKTKELDRKIENWALITFTHLEVCKMLDHTYDNMVDTLQEFGFTQQKPPSKEIVMDAIKTLSLKQLEAIKKFQKPIICITPKGSFADKVGAIDAHKKMPGQIKTHLDLPSNDRIWGGDTTTMVVTIVDGLESLSRPDYIKNNMNLGQQMDKYEEKFKEDQLEVMSTQEGAMIMMQSLKDGKPIDDVLNAHTATSYNRNHLTKDSVMPFGSWDSEDRQVFFSYNNPIGQNTPLRCRPSVKILELLS